MHSKYCNHQIFIISSISILGPLVLLLSSLWKEQLMVKDLISRNMKYNKVQSWKCHWRQTAEQTHRLATCICLLSAEPRRRRLYVPCCRRVRTRRHRRRREVLTTRCQTSAHNTTFQRFTAFDHGTNQHLYMHMFYNSLKLWCGYQLLHLNRLTA